MISVVQLGRVDYATALELQRTLVDLRKQDKIPDTLLLLEHSPVVTLGRNAKDKNLLFSREQLAARGVELFECDRGGDVTFHGPGQLVGYPIFDLRQFTGPDGQRKTLGAVEYVRRIEEALIRTCVELGVPATRVAGLTGVWTEDGGSGQAKVAAIGVHISRAVTSHGFALNVNTDLDYFKLIVPCGISDKTVTSLAKELGNEMDWQVVCESLTRSFGRVFKRQILWVESLDALLGRKVGIPLQVPEELRRIGGEEDFRMA